MLFCFSILMFIRFIVAEDDFCAAIELVCKPHPITKNIDKVIRRWLSKVEKNPHCIAGPNSETIHNEDEETFEVVTLVNGRKDGISIIFLDQNLRFVSRITRLKEGVEVGPSWDMTMGRGYNSSLNFRALSSSLTHETTPMDMFGGGALYDRSVWLYPDLETVMVGQWSLEGQMQFAQVNTRPHTRKIYIGRMTSH